MLTTRQNQNALAAVAGTVTRGLVNELARNAVSYVGNQLTGGRQANLPRQEFGGGSIVRMSKAQGPRRQQAKRKKSRRQSRRNGNLVSRLPSSMGGTVDDRIRVTFRDALVLSNSGAGTTSLYYQLATTYTVTHDMRTWLPRAGTTMSSAFRFFHVTRAVFCFQPTLAYSSSGYVVLGVDPTPDAVAPTAIGDVIRHHPSVVGDVKDAHSIIWVPGDDTENQDKLVNLAGTVTAPEHICHGVVQIFSNNSEAVNAQFGLLTYEVDVEFFGLA